MLGYMAQLFFKRHAFYPEANLAVPFKLLPFFVLGGLGTASYQTLLQIIKMIAQKGADRLCHKHYFSNFPFAFINFTK